MAGIRKYMEANADKFQGPQGPPGNDAQIDIDKIADAVVSKLPPITVRTVDSQGNVKDSVSVKLGETLNLNHSFDRN